MKVEAILKTTDAKTLFELFKKYTDQLVKNTESLGIFAIDDEQVCVKCGSEDLNHGHNGEISCNNCGSVSNVFENSDIRKVVKQLKEKRK